MNSYKAYYRRRSDGDGDLVAVVATPQSENVDEKEHSVLDEALREAFFSMSNDEFFAIEGGECDFPETLSRNNA